MSLSGVGLAGVRVKSVTHVLNDEGKWDIYGEFQIMGSHGKPIAKQSFGEGYGKDLKLNESAEAHASREKLLATLAGDINKLLGLG